MTLTEVLVVIAVLAVLIIVFAPWQEPPEVRKASRINCVFNLKEINLAGRLWAQDHNDKYPMQVSITATNGGGAMELAAAGNVAAAFRVMSNELSNPKILHCAADTDRVYATNFTTDFSAKNISYFVGLDANEDSPQTILSGDDNFTVGGVPVKSGVVEIATNTPVAWTAARHKFAGNIALGDGSVQQTTTKSLQDSLLNTGSPTNRFAIP
jgi:hypothetical protein